MVLITRGTHYSLQWLEARLIEVRPENILIEREYGENGTFSHFHLWDKLFLNDSDLLRFSETCELHSSRRLLVYEDVFLSSGCLEQSSHVSEKRNKTFLKSWFSRS